MCGKIIKHATESVNALPFHAYEYYITLIPFDIYKYIAGPYLNLTVVIAL
jgi:hypothetical protein